MLRINVNFVQVQPHWRVVSSAIHHHPVSTVQVVTSSTELSAVSARHLFPDAPNVLIFLLVSIVTQDISSILPLMVANFARLPCRVVFSVRITAPVCSAKVVTI